MIHRAKTCVALVALTSLATLAAPAQAQWGVWGADSLLAAGRVTAAESLYYAASSASPRDPGPRAALGRYLAARGALRIGAVLLEEARVFGGDTASLARALSRCIAPSVTIARLRHSRNLHCRHPSRTAPNGW